MIRPSFEPKAETMVEFHDGLLTAREAAAYLRVSLNTLALMIKMMSNSGGGA
jgi:hypothetical protein